MAEQLHILNPQEVETQIAKAAEDCGIDLNAYGQASPTKLIYKSIIAASQMLENATKVAMSERNPLTAMEFRSLLGLAAITGNNPASLLKASLGKVKLTMPTNLTATVKQHAKILSEDNLAYYVVLPSEQVVVKNGDELIVKQGTLKSQQFISTGEKHETFQLQAQNFVDVESIEVFVDNSRLSVGRQISDGKECVATLDYNGNMVVMITNSILLSAGKSVTINYADCIGIGGDMLTVGDYFKSSAFAFNGDNDVTEDVQITLSEPIIGGTDFDYLYEDLRQQIMLGGNNNLIGNEQQMLTYIKRYKQYAVQNSSLQSGILVLYCLRNLEFAVRSQPYWTACQNLDLTEDDIRAMQYHLNNLDFKSTDLLCKVQHAKPEHCKIIVSINGQADLTDVMAVVEAYLAKNFSDRQYEVGDLYGQLMQVDNVKQCYIRFLGNVNEYGSAVPKDASHILVCTGADIIIDGTKTTYGSYVPDTEQTIEEEVKVLTETAIADNKIISDSKLS